MIPTYPSLERIERLLPGPQVLLGATLYWTEKRDGSQLRVAWVDNRLRVFTRNQEASPGFQRYLEATPQYAALVAFACRADSIPGVSDFALPIIYGELLVRGKSPARYEIHDRHEFVIFDVRLTTASGDGPFMPYPALQAECIHYGLPVVDCWRLCRHTTLETLYACRTQVLEIAATQGREGAVVKAYGPQVFAKEKRDTPRLREHREEGAVVLPPLPDSEVMGAIAKAHADLGDDFRDRTKAMPLIARLVQAEQEKHLCRKPSRSLYLDYLDYLAGLE